MGLTPVSPIQLAQTTRQLKLKITRQPPSLIRGQPIEVPQQRTIAIDGSCIIKNGFDNATALTASVCCVGFLRRKCAWDNYIVVLTPTI